MVPRFTLSQEQLDKKTVAALVLQEGAEVDQEECSACSENVSEYIRIVMAELTVCENRDKGGHGSTARWLSWKMVANKKSWKQQTLHGLGAYSTSHLAFELPPYGAINEGWVPKGWHQRKKAASSFDISERGLSLCRNSVVDASWQ